jgi:hypothetical protein
MKKLLTLAALLLMAAPAMAQQQVSGYYRSNGTYVAPYVRSTPNYTVRDNYSYQGNTNPYTGQQGTNNYTSSPSSQYYNGGAYSQPSYGYGRR